MNLESIQRAMAAAVMQPLTPGDTMRERTPEGRSMADVAASFIAPNSQLTAFERLEIYNRQYWFRVLGALQEDFPALRAVLGSARFEALSIAYLTAHPSRSFSLRNLGSKLPDWLAAHPEHTGRRHSFAVDAARVEWAFVESFDSAERTPLTLPQISALDAQSRLALQPHLQLMALSYPADNLVLSLHDREKRLANEAGVKHEDQTEAPANLAKLRRRPTWLAAHRVDFSVYYRRLRQEEFLTLAALRQGRPLGESIDHAFAASAIPGPRRAARVRAWFANWAQFGWICAAESQWG
ncbi:MAG: DNA-binding domain-containing protein [Terracidiphilus sp.]